MVSKSMEEGERELIYRRSFFGDIYPCEILSLVDPSTAAYQIEVQIPIDFSLYEEAAECSAHLRFQKMDGHIVLCIYSDFSQGFNKDREWCETASGHIIDKIAWREWWKYSMQKSVCHFTSASDPLDDFIPCGETWDDIFQVKRLPEGWGRNVQSLAYSVHVFENNHNK